MRVLVAGATGVVGAPMLDALRAGGHEVLALHRPGGAPPGRADVTWVAADVLDGPGLLRATRDLHADAVLAQLTALKRPPARHRDMRQTNLLRTEGTANLLAVARQVGANRFLTQSMMFGYGYDDQGARLRPETDRFAPTGRGRFEPHLAAMRANETQVLTAAGIDGIVLRYGLFYGGAADAPLVEGVRRRRLPVLRECSPLSFVHVQDAATAAVAALERGRPGQAYNIADDEPVGWTGFVRHVATVLASPPPRTVPAGLVRRVLPYAAALLQGGTCLDTSKARDELGWRPAFPDHRSGLAGLADHPAG